MPAVELTDQRLDYLADLVARDGDELFARFLRSQTFRERGIRAPEARNVTYVYTPPTDAA